MLTRSADSRWSAITVQSLYSVNVTFAYVIHFHVAKRMWPLHADCTVQIELQVMIIAIYWLLIMRSLVTRLIPSISMLHAEKQEGLIPEVTWFYGMMTRRPAVKRLLQKSYCCRLHTYFTCSFYRSLELKLSYHAWLTVSKTLPHTDCTVWTEVPWTYIVADLLLTHA